MKGSTDTPPLMALLELFESFLSASAVMTAADLGVADALGAEPTSSADLAAAIGTHGPSTRRLLRVLAAAGVVAEAEPDRFVLTPLGRALRSDAPASLRFPFQFFGRLLLPALADAPRAVQSGEPSFERVFGAPVYDYLTKHPDDEEMFGRAMETMSRAVGRPVSQAYDFTGIETLVDVGGGHGQRTIEILSAHPAMRAVVFDRPSVVDEAVTSLARAGLAERCNVVGGSFFDGVPAGGDCYLLSGVIANWDDSKAQLILRNCRQAMVPDSRLLIVEPVLAPTASSPPAPGLPALGQVIDLVMLVMLGGRVRTEAEHADLLRSAGLRLTRVVTTTSPMGIVGPVSLVEALPA